MKRAILIVLVLASSMPAATYYVSPTGSNTSPYDTWAKAANLPSTAVTAGNTDVGGDGPHTMYVAPGTYAKFSVVDSDWQGSRIVGTAAVGTLTPAQMLDVCVSTTTGGALTVSANDVDIENISVFSTSTLAAVGIDSSAAVFKNCFFKSRNSSSVDVYGATGTIRFSNSFLAPGSGTTSGNLSTVAGSAATVEIENCYLLPYDDAVYAVNGALRIASPATVVVRNSIVGDGFRPALYVTSATANITVQNSVLIAPVSATTGVVAIDAPAQTVSLENVATYRFFSSANDLPWTNALDIADSVFINEPLYTVDYGREAYIIPTVDDLFGNPQHGFIPDPNFALEVAQCLAKYGMSGTYYVEASEIAEHMDILGDIVGTGAMTIGCHGYTHSDLELTTAMLITKAGATVDVNRTSNTITVNPGGSVTTFKTKTLGAVKGELEAFGCTVSITADLQELTLGEVLADSSGSQASPYQAMLLIDETGATGYYYVEIPYAKSVAETLLGYEVPSYASPWTKTSAAIRTVVQNAGFLHFRAGTAKNSVSSMDMFQQPVLLCSEMGEETDANVAKYADSLALSALAGGQNIFLLAHSYNDEFTVEQLDVVFDRLSKYPQIKVVSADKFISDIRYSGMWQTTDDRIFTRSYPNVQLWQPQKGSVAIDNGTWLSNHLDFYGHDRNKYGLGWDIGPIEYRPKFGIRK